jgi:hypothetical protein
MVTLALEEDIRPGADLPAALLYRRALCDTRRVQMPSSGDDVRG